MNTPVCNKEYKMKHLVCISLVLCLLAACKKEDRYIYQVQDQALYQNSGQKTNLKSPTQFASIAYNDLFNAAITGSELNSLNVDLESFGDKTVIEDMVVKTFLNRSGAQVPTDAAMRDDIPTFIKQTYLRFYNRQPASFEAWKLQQLIQQNTDITAQMVYYSFMTSEEYRYY
jgi:hypothetical protein